MRLKGASWVKVPRSPPPSSTSEAALIGANKARARGLTSPSDGRRGRSEREGIDWPPGGLSAARTSL